MFTLTSHLYGFSPVCVRLWICNAEADEKLFEHTLHVCCEVDDVRFIDAVSSRLLSESFLSSNVNVLKFFVFWLNAAAAAKNGKNWGLNNENDGILTYVWSSSSWF